jgi:hypothetical protein
LEQFKNEIACTMGGTRKRRATEMPSSAAALGSLAHIAGNCHVSASALSAVLGMLAEHAPQLGLPRTQKDIENAEGFPELLKQRTAVQAYCPVCGQSQSAPDAVALRATALAAGAAPPFNVACTAVPCAGQPWAAYDQPGGGLKLVPPCYDLFMHPEFQLRDLMQREDFWASYDKQHAELAERRREWAGLGRGGKLTVYKDWMNEAAYEWYRDFGGHVPETCARVEGAHVYVHVRRLSDYMSPSTNITGHTAVSIGGGMLEILSLSRGVRKLKGNQLIEQVTRRAPPALSDARRCACRSWETARRRTTTPSA